MWINGHVYACINADTDIDISTDLYAYSSQHSTFHLGCVPIYLEIYNVRSFTLLAMPRQMQKARATIPEHVREMKNMNQGVEQNEQSETICLDRAIWEGKAIMGTVRDPIATYSFVISISRANRLENEC
jgi:hypothetical protein